MRKILVNIMSRANYGRLTSVIKAIQDNPNLELQLVLGASFYNADIEFPVTKRVQCLINSDDHEAMALTTGVLLTKMSQAYAELKPDVVLIHADRYEMLACAIASSYMNIPLAHTEGGEDSGCIDDKVRNAITQLADIHFTTTKSAYCRVRDLGRSNIYHVGSPALDLLEVMDLTNNRKEDYILVVFHPNTTEKESVEPLINVLKTLNINVIWVNPNVDAGNKAFLKEIHKNNFEFLKDLPPEEYYRLLANCKLAIGNSSSFIKEASFLGTKVILIGNRQKLRERAYNVVSIDNVEREILNTIDICFKYDKKIEKSTLFGDGKSGGKIAKILEEVDL